ncbi:MAG TPA: GH3 auxin-responsive promoter family protein [Candidatus Bathyarchaeia archaeon]|nr:GH3 auxin-responsive promoter family protein [Candidatus Bathyarchaeia archaeon]
MILKETFNIVWVTRMFSSVDALPAPFQQVLGPWYGSLNDPGATQQAILLKLLKAYEKTEYGQTHAAARMQTILDFRSNFPRMSYKDLKPYLEEVKRGKYTAILPEPPVCWVMTRGSTGVAKVFPTTQTHLQQILQCGARALLNYAVKKNDWEILTGRILNLNFPSAVTSVDIAGQKTTFGYSSGTYARLNPALNEVSLVPKQEEIDALGGGIKRKDWEARFDLVYEKALDQDVVATMGVAPVILSFARYVGRKYGRRPRDLWKLHALFLTSVAKIHFRYGPLLRSYFGDVPIVEIYSATEGVFAQQLDDFPYVVPNYDAYFLEAETREGAKMLYELERGEWGRILISSSLFPRYDIGDLIEAMGNNYFRVFGRNKPLTVLEHVLYRGLFGWFL